MKFLICLYLYGIYPFCTLWLASFASLIDENLSYVGNLEGMRPYFIGWAVMCELALAIGFKMCMPKCIHSRVLTPLMLLSAGMFLISIVLPYIPQIYPLSAQLHITLSFIGLLMILSVAAMMVLSLKMTYSIYPYDYVLFIIYGIALGIYGAHYMSVNSLVEVFLGITLPIYLYRLGGKLQ